jgi:hypothetical protein
MYKNVGHVDDVRNAAVLFYSIILTCLGAGICRYRYAGPNMRHGEGNVVCTGYRKDVVKCRASVITYFLSSVLKLN